MPRKPPGKRQPQAAVGPEHGRFDYSPIIDRPRLSWPNGARVAVWVIPNIEHFHFDRPGTPLEQSGLNPDVLNYSWRDYGVRVGVWRMMEVMEKYGVKGTVALNSERLQALSAHHRRGHKTRLGMDGTWHLELHPDQQPIGAQERALSRRWSADCQERRQGAARLAQPGDERDRAHARYSGRDTASITSATRSTMSSPIRCA